MLSTIIRSVLACAGFISIGAAQAQAPASALDAIQSAGTLRICTTGDYKPFTNAVGDGFEGIDIEMAKSLAKAIGVEPKFVRTEMGPSSCPISPAANATSPWAASA